MGGLKIARWNINGFREIRQSEKVAALIEQHAQQAVSQLGEGYTYSARPGRNRYRALVYAQGSAGISRELRQQNLLRYAAANGFKMNKGG